MGHRALGWVATASIGGAAVTFAATAFSVGAAGNDPRPVVIAAAAALVIGVLAAVGWRLTHRQLKDESGSTDDEAARQAEINVRLRSGDIDDLIRTGEMRATLAVSSPTVPLSKCSVRLLWIETVDTIDALTHRIQPTYFQWGVGEPGAYGPAREFLDIAAIPGDEHIVDVAITTHPEGFKPARAGDDLKNLPDWSFRLASANEHNEFHEGWYRATLLIAADSDPPFSREVVVALGLKKDGTSLYVKLRLEDWDTIADSLPSLPPGLAPTAARQS